MKYIHDPYLNKMKSKIMNAKMIIFIIMGLLLNQQKMLNL